MFQAFSTVETVKNIDEKSIIVEFATRKDAEIVRFSYFSFLNSLFYYYFKGIC